MFKNLTRVGWRHRAFLTLTVAVFGSGISDHLCANSPSSLEAQQVIQAESVDAAAERAFGAELPATDEPVTIHLGLWNASKDFKVFRVFVQYVTDEGKPGWYTLADWSEVVPGELHEPPTYELGLRIVKIRYWWKCRRGLFAQWHNSEWSEAAPGNFIRYGFCLWTDDCRDPSAYVVESALP